MKAARGVADLSASFFKGLATIMAYFPWLLTALVILVVVYQCLNAGVLLQVPQEILHSLLYSLVAPIWAWRDLGSYIYGCATGTPCSVEWIGKDGILWEFH